MNVYDHDARATQKQIDMIQKLLAELGDDRAYNYATLTKSEASQVIEDLLDEKDDSKFIEDY